jgi:hypothetical protein
MMRDNDQQRAGHRLGLFIDARQIALLMSYKDCCQMDSDQRTIVVLKFVWG